MPFCIQCGSANQDASGFCTSCGERLQRGDSSAWSQAGLAPSLITLRSLSIGERIVIGGAILAIVSFFLPWFSASGFGRTEQLTGIGALQLTGAVLLEPLIAALAAGLVLVTHGASTPARLQVAGWQIVLGCIFALPGITAAIAPIPFLAGTLAFGWWGLTLGYLAIIVGGFALINSLSGNLRTAITG